MLLTLELHYVVQAGSATAKFLELVNRDGLLVLPWHVEPELLVDAVDRHHILLLAWRLLMRVAHHVGLPLLLACLLVGAALAKWVIWRYFAVLISHPFNLKDIITSFA